jgi:hypothetical protein
MKIRHSEEVKSKVLELGRVGKTYTEIQAIYPIPKSTLSYWFKNAEVVRDPSKQLEHLKRAREKSSVVKRSQKQARISESCEQARKLAQSLPVERSDVAKSLLAMLYWAEGGKQDGNFKFTNTDPDLQLLFISLLRESYVLDESRFKVALQVHYYHKHIEVVSFWSALLGIPKSQFWKIHVKKRSAVGKRFRKNFMGICHLHYGSSAIQRELLALGKDIGIKLRTYKPSSVNG